MEELRERRVKTTARKNKNNDYLVGVMTTQIVVCLVVFGIVFAVTKLNPAAGEELRKFYDTALSVDWNSQEAMASVKRAGEFLLSPADVWRSVPSGGVDIVLDGEGKLPVKNAAFSPLTVTVPIAVPADGKVTSRFGYRIHPITKKEGFHTGIDIAAPQGENISAAFDGTVSEAGENNGNGKYIIISHGDFSTVYCHCSEIIVTEGAKVRAGETVAFVGQTGMATGPHLHFEIRRNGVYYNPEWVLETENEDKIS